MVNGGQCLGRSDSKVIFAWNALPGEETEVELSKNKKDFAEGTTVSWTNTSPDRATPREDHFLICSPWQIMTYDAENKFKREMSAEALVRIGGLDLKDELQIVSLPAQFGYRNKIEYSFATTADGVALGFFERGEHLHTAIEECALASTAMNKTAKIILAWINEVKIPIRSLKSLIVRGNQAGETIAALFIKDKLEFVNYPVLASGWLGFQLYYSDHRCPASRPDALLYSVGQNYLTEKLGSTKFQFGLLSFFQINVPMFELALNDIASFVKADDFVLDYYSGTGAIGIALAGNCKKVILVESNPEAVEYAQINIQTNKLEQKCEAVLKPAEKMLELIKSDTTLVFDPPRSGLHEDVVNRALEQKPERIIYLSCNVATQARDIKLLSAGYQVKFLKLYNFFPRTPHVESLCMLEKC